jgi:hypothetical protein
VIAMTSERRTRVMKLVREAVSQQNYPILPIKFKRIVSSVFASPAVLAGEVTDEEIVYRVLLALQDYDRKAAVVEYRYNSY